jgi:hypothetical protein
MVRIHSQLQQTIMQVVVCVYLKELSVLCNDKQIIQQQNYREKRNEDDSLVDVCLSDRRIIISVEEEEEERIEKGDWYMNLSHLLQPTNMLS